MKDIKIVPAGQVDDSQDENLKIIIGKKGSEETFLAYGDLPGIILLQILLTQANVEDMSDEEAGIAMLTVAQDTFKAIFEEEEYKKFMAYLYNPKNKVSLDNILDIFSQIIDGYSEERPTNG